MNVGKNNTPLLVLGLLLSATLLLRCSGSSSSDTQNLANAGSAGSGGAGASGSGGSSGSPISPGMDCTVANDCAKPQDTCSGPLQITYTDPMCTVGNCSWTSHQTICPFGCYSGICQAQGSAGAGGGGPTYGVCGDPGAAGAPDSPCELPSSVCADDRWLLYFTDPRCVAGSCQATVQAYDCGDVGCRFGGCVTSTTTK